MLVNINSGDSVQSSSSTQGKILYSYGLFSDEPMSEQMNLLVQHNYELSKIPYEVLQKNEVQEDLGLVESEVPGITNAYDSVRRGVAKSDIARLVSVYVRGGQYLDLDVRLKQVPPMSDTDVILYTETFSLKDKHFTRIANFALSSPAKHPFLLSVLQEIVGRVEGLAGKASWSDKDVLNTTGPDVITTVYHRSTDKTVKRLSFWQSRHTLQHKCAGSWRNGHDK
jgi:mannosyltransferase OCH1-like enzyme